MYEIVNVQYTGTYNNGGTSIPAVLGEFRASSAADLPAQNVDCHIICGCDGLDIATGDRYIWNGTAWILQPKDNAFTNVYTKAEIDNMSNVIYQTMLYYHTAQESSDGSITFYTLGTPVSNLTIYGNGQQTGTPTPDNPVMPEFVGVRTGNLWDKGVPLYVYTKDYKKYNADNSIKLKAGTYTISSDGRVPTIQAFDDNNEHIVPISDAISYGVQYYIQWDNYAIGPKSDAVRNVTITLLRDCTLTFAVTANIGTYIMLNSGSTALPYEPFGWAVPITCAGQTVPVYLGQTQTVRRVKKIKASDITWIDGSETGFNFYRGTLTIPKLAGGGVSTLLSNKYCLAETINNLLDGYIASYNRTTIETIVIRDDRYSSAADWLTANGDTEIWYVLAEPETGIVNEPLAKIGTYADELHSEDAAVTIPTAKGQNTLTVDTELPPSLIEISGGNMHE